MPNANRDKGNKFERDLARYFRRHGLANAKRRVVTGWRTATEIDPDLGDLKNIAGICAQAKNVAKSYPRGLAGKALLDIMAEAQEQADAQGAALPIVVEKRPGHADIGMSWVHMPANLYIALMTGNDPYGGLRLYAHPVRVELHDIIDQLVRFSRMCEEDPEVAA